MSTAAGAGRNSIFRIISRLTSSEQAMHRRDKALEYCLSWGNPDSESDLCANIGVARVFDGGGVLWTFTTELVCLSLIVRLTS